MLKFYIESLDEVEEQYRDLYEASGSGFRLKVAGALSEAEANARIEAINKKKVELLDELKKTKKRFEGIDPEEVARLREQASKPPKDADSGWAEREATLRKAHEAEIAKLSSKVQALSEKFKANKFHAEAASAIAKAKGHTALLLPLLRDRVQWEIDEETGEPVMVVLNESGAPMLGPDAKPATLDDLIAVMKTQDVYAPAFEEHRMQGSNARGGVRSSGNDQANPWTTGNLTEQMRITKENPTRAAELRRLAGK